MQNGKYSQAAVDDALAVVQDFDLIGVGARDLRECLLRQLKAFDPQNTLAQQIVSEHLKQVQSNQLKEIARARNRRLEVVNRALDVIKKLDPRRGLRYNKAEPRLVEPDVYFRKVDDQWQAFLNEDDMPQLRLSPTYRRLLVRDAADRDVRNSVIEEFALPCDDGLADAQDSVFALLDVFHQLNRGGEAVLHVSTHVALRGVAHQQAAVGRAQAQLRHVVFIQEGLPLIVDFAEIDIRLDEAGLGFVVAESRPRIELLDDVESAFYDLQRAIQSPRDFL